MAQDPFLLERGVTQHCVQRQHQWRRQPVDEIADHRALRPAKDAIFVLEPDRIDPALVDPAGSLGKVTGAVFVDHPCHVAIGERGRGIVERVDIDANGTVITTQLFYQIASERGDAALARGKCANQCDPPRYAPGCAFARRGKDRKDFGGAGRIAEQKLAEFFAVHRAGVLSVRVRSG